MSKITDEKFEQLSHLARLEFNENEKIKLKQDLENILNLCESLTKIDTTDVEPLIHLTNTSDNLREDEVIEQINREEALKNAPKKDSDFFRVPKVIEQKSN